MRSHPFSHPEQFVFHKEQDEETIRNSSKGKGKGKAPMFPIDMNPMDVNLDLDDQEEDKRDSKIIDNPQERRYFTKSTPMGTPASGLDNRRANTMPTIDDAPKSAAAASKSAKKSRFSFLKKSHDGIAAH